MYFFKYIIFAQKSMSAFHLPDKGETANQVSGADSVHSE